jgi:hypothetical protein
VYLDDNERTLERLKNSGISAIDLVEGIGAVNMLEVFREGAIPRLTGISRGEIATS